MHSYFCKTFHWDLFRTDCWFSEEPVSGSRISKNQSETHGSMPSCLLWCVRTDTTCLWLTTVNWSNILAVCDMFGIMFCLIWIIRKILWKTQRPAVHQAACPNLNFVHRLHVHYLLNNYNPQNTQCPAPYATPVVHIWSANTHEEGTGIGFPG